MERLSPDRAQDPPLWTLFLIKSVCSLSLSLSLALQRTHQENLAFAHLSYTHNRALGGAQQIWARVAPHALDCRDIFALLQHPILPCTLSDNIDVIGRRGQHWVAHKECWYYFVGNAGRLRAGILFDPFNHKKIMGGARGAVWAGWCGG